MPPRALSMTICLVAAAGTRPLPAAELADRTPPGKYFKLGPDAHQDAPTYRLGQPIVGTSYFYWYDVYSGAHVRDGDGTDGMTTHPPQSAMADLSYKSPIWHYWQLRDVCQAGIDFIMPVYWGLPGRYDEWSFAGLPPLIEAHERMLADNKKDPQDHPVPPKIGLFYDTSTLQFNIHPDGRREVQIDLTTPYGRDWFYVAIRDFFSMIPPDKWARIDGRPIVFLYAASFAAKLDDRLFEDARARFKADFATDLFLVRHVDWPGRADGWYQWGGALGLKLGDIVAGLGPGYNDSAVQGRIPVIVERRDGRFYEQQWEHLLGMHPNRRPWIVHVETWNEWHEGTDVARSQEWGTRYMAATAKHAALFRAGKQLEPSGDFVNARRVRWSGKVMSGLTLRPSEGDGCWERVEIDDSRAVVTVPAPQGPAGRYLYFDVDDSYLYDEMQRVAEVTVVFRDDGGCERFRIDYDSGDPESGPGSGAFRPGRWVEVGNANTWRIIKQQLPDIRFTNRANSADFRLAVEGGRGRLTVREVIVRALAGQITVPPQPPTSAPSSP